MIKKLTKSFIVYLNDALQIMFVRCRNTGKFAKHSLAILELEKLEKYSCMTVLFLCAMSFLNGLFFLSQSFDLKQIVLFNIVGASSILFTFFLSLFNDDEN